MRILIYLGAASNEQYTFHRIREYKHGGELINRVNTSRNQVSRRIDSIETMEQRYDRSDFNLPTLSVPRFQ